MKRILLDGKHRRPLIREPEPMLQEHIVHAVMVVFVFFVIALIFAGMAIYLGKRV